MEEENISFLLVRLHSRWHCLSVLLWSIPVLILEATSSDFQCRQRPVALQESCRPLEPVLYLLDFHPLLCLLVTVGLLMQRSVNKFDEFPFNIDWFDQICSFKEQWLIYIPQVTFESLSNISLINKFDLDLLMCVSCFLKKNY